MYAVMRSVQSGNVLQCHPAYVNEINKRYAECIQNDLADCDRGLRNVFCFRQVWAREQALLDLHSDAVHTVYKLSCEYLAKMFVIPFECAHPSEAVVPASSSTPRLQLNDSSRSTGAGSRERRNAARAHLQTNYNQEPPPGYVPQLPSP